jgi:alcohol dehydrogenase, propanol-preferring
VPLALKAVRKGGRVVCAGIHMSDIPSFPYRLLWEERQLVSVSNLTRQDGIDFLRLAPQIGIVTQTSRYLLDQANQALADLRAGRFEGAAAAPPRGRAALAVVAVAWPALAASQRACRHSPAKAVWTVLGFG